MKAFAFIAVQTVVPFMFAMPLISTNTNPLYLAFLLACCFAVPMCGIAMYIEGLTDKYFELRRKYTFIKKTL